MRRFLTLMIVLALVGLSLTGCEQQVSDPDGPAIENTVDRSDHLRALDAAFRTVTWQEYTVALGKSDEIEVIQPVGVEVALWTYPDPRYADDVLGAEFFTYTLAGTDGEGNPLVDNFAQHVTPPTPWNAPPIELRIPGGDKNGGTGLIAEPDTAYSDNGSG